jgi:DNA-binding NtrC family response regulator/tetratricopeptide (TPR) repeat protein
VHLVADRFAVEDDGRAMDLASGTQILLTVRTAGGTFDQLRWTVRCDTLHALHHRNIARLVDFGLVGETSRFEAWVCGTPFVGSREQVRSIAAAASRFFQFAGMTMDSRMAPAIHEGPTGPVFVPGDGTGYPDGSSVPKPEDLLVADCGLRTASRPALATLSEMFQNGEIRRPHVAVVWGLRGSGRATVAMELARIARINGFVPVAACLLDEGYEALLAGRTLFVIAGDAGRDAWDARLRTAIRSPRAHVFLLLSEHESRVADSIRLAPLSTAALVAAVYPHVADPRQQRRINHAAESAHGLPGRFMRLLWREPEYRRPSTGIVLRVAEHAAVYGGADRVSDPCMVASTVDRPAPGDRGLLRRRMEIAVGDLQRGRHARGIRQLRHVVAALARRGHWTEAAEGAVALASSLLRRGRTRQAQDALDAARHHASRGERSELLADVAILSGEAWIDLARLDEAEAVLTTAVTTARERQDAARTTAASIALARCLYWRGRYADASAALGAAETIASMPRRHELLAARIALGNGETSRAMTIVSTVLAAARSAQDAESTAAAACCATLIHLAAGDLDAAERDLSEALSASQRPRDPQRAIRARLLQAEIQRRRGHGRAAATDVRRLARAASAAPPLVRARWNIMSALLDDVQDPHAVVARHVAASGLGALGLYAGSEGAHTRADAGGDSLVHEAVAIVRACQTAVDETVVLKDLCARLRQQVHAAAIAFVSPTSASKALTIVEGDGARIDPSVAERAMTAGITIAPHRHDDRIDAGVPVQYGGAVIGALCARWTIGSTYDLSRAGQVLEMAAAAAAPILSAAMSRRVQKAATSGIELLGVTPVMDELRRNVERAAAAPFSTLIDGESGSGKELVARAVHQFGSRRDRPFCTLNCAALPDDLVEAELFGHARGAFTGAVVERAGVFEEAHGGTLFLDEIGELSARAQAKVLRVIQEGELRRVGENVSRRVDVRIVAATNRDLRKDVEAGRFRLDLWYRLDVIRITVPPLRDRREDVAVLAEHFWRDATHRLGSRATLSAAAVAALARYDWPGNVRELQNVAAALAVRSPKRGVVPPTALPAHIVDRAHGETWTLVDARRTFDERFIRAALVRTGGHRGRAAAELGVTRQGLTKLMARLGIAT